MIQIIQPNSEQNQTILLIFQTNKHQTYLITNVKPIKQLDVLFYKQNCIANPYTKMNKWFYTAHAIVFVACCNAFWDSFTTQVCLGVK